MNADRIDGDNVATSLMDQGLSPEQLQTGRALRVAWNKRGRHQ